MKRETPRDGGSAIGVALCKSSLTISSSRTSLADRDQILAASSLTVGLATEEEGRENWWMRVAQKTSVAAHLSLSVCQQTRAENLCPPHKLASWLEPEEQSVTSKCLQRWRGRGAL